MKILADMAEVKEPSAADKIAHEQLREIAHATMRALAADRIFIMVSRETEDAMESFQIEAVNGDRTLTADEKIINLQTLIHMLADKLDKVGCDLTLRIRQTGQELTFPDPEREDDQ